MSPDLAITIILGGEAAVIGVTGGILAWHAARLTKDPESFEKLKRVLAADNRARDHEAEPDPKSINGRRAGTRSAARIAANGRTGSAGRAAQLRCGASNPSR
jgi:hypothetical protein